MRKHFIGYYPPTEDELKQIWQTGIIVLDANVLLNLYRYSKDAKKSLLDLIASLKNRLWLPHQVAMEYHRHRLSQIYNERKNCDDFVAGVRKLLTNLDESRRHPFVSSDLRLKLDAIVESLEAEIKPAQKELDDFKRNDPILDQLTALYDGKVGDEPNATTKEAWLADGEDRYRRGIPPGFEDRKKADERKYGDLLVWREILAYAGEKKVPVIFVTDDAKKDWWREQNGETVGPNPALIAEMVAATGQPYHMYRPERFVEFAGKQGASPVPEKVVQEVKSVRVADRITARALETLATKTAEYTTIHKMAEAPDYSALLKAAAGMPDYSAILRAATAVPDYPALLKAAAAMPDYSAIFRAAIAVPDYSALLKAAAAMPDYSAIFRAATAVPDYSALLKTAAAMPDYSGLLKAATLGNSSATKGETGSAEPTIVSEAAMAAQASSSELTTSSEASAAESGSDQTTDPQNPDNGTL